MRHGGGRSHPENVEYGHRLGERIAARPDALRRYIAAQPVPKRLLHSLTRPTRDWQRVR